MCSGLVCGIVTSVLGAALVVATGLLGFHFIPGIIDDRIINEVVLLNDTVQMERFKEVPFPLEFSVRAFNISNAEQVLQGGLPVLTELGPYVYKMYQRRVIETMDADKMTYRMTMSCEFDSEASFPYTEDDIVHVANVAYHGVLQVTESIMPGLVGLLSLALDGIFREYNSPIARVRAGDLFFDGMDICKSPGIAGGFACIIIRGMTDNIQNMEIQEDNSIKFSFFNYRNNQLGKLLEIYRGIENHEDLARITALNNYSTLPYWVGAVTGDGGDDNATEPAPAGPSYCDMINGTDSGIFAPFVDTSKSLYAVNTDICRSVELRYQGDVDFKGIPAVRFSANEWFLDNDDGCFCINVTNGITAPNGCLFRGAQELFSCVGAYMVLTYPHFLYADLRYRNGVLGLNPVAENHRIFLDLEPNTGTVVRGAKRAQFNVFMRAIDGISATQNLRTTLTPIVWIEEGMTLTDEYADLLSNDVVFTLNLVRILVPVLVAFSAAVLLAGITILICVSCRKKTS